MPFFVVVKSFLAIEKLFSFEIKKYIDKSNYRESFFKLFQTPHGVMKDI